MRGSGRHLKAAALLAAFGLASCSATFDVTVQSEATIEGGGLFGGLLGRTFGDFASMDLSQTQDFKNAGVAKEDVESVKMRSFRLQVTRPAGATLEFVDGIEFFVEAEGLPKKRIAHKDAIPDTATSIELEPDGVELAPYVTAPSMSVTTAATAHAPQDDTTLSATIVFEVDPKIL